MINYYLLTKPGIVLGNLFTFAAGFFLASKGQMYPMLFFMTLLGLAFVMGSACVFNNYIDRDLDKKMKRTKDRALVKKLISSPRAIFFAVILGILGFLLLYAYTNPLTVFITFFGFFIYVILYSLWKGHTVYSTAIGSIAGATPPVIGYCAVSEQFDAGAFILFMILVLWQMPHFFAIALYNLDDYTAADIPVLPVKEGVYKTKVHMIVYILSFIVASSLLTILNYTGYTYLFATVVLGFIWLGLGIRGFQSSNAQLWGRQMFRFSLVVIGAFCLLIPIDS